MLFTNDERLTRPANKPLGIFSTKVKVTDFDQGKEVSSEMTKFFRKYMRERFNCLIEWYNYTQEEIPEGREDLIWDSNDLYNKVVELGEEVEDKFQIIDGIDLSEVDYRRVDLDEPRSLWEIHLLRRCFPKAKSIESLYKKAKNRCAVFNWIRLAIAFAAIVYLTYLIIEASRNYMNIAFLGITLVCLVIGICTVIGAKNSGREYLAVAKADRKDAEEEAEIARATGRGRSIYKWELVRRKTLSDYYREGEK